MLVYTHWCLVGSVGVSIHNLVGVANVYTYIHIYVVPKDGIFGNPLQQP